MTRTSDRTQSANGNGRQNGPSDRAGANGQMGIPMIANGGGGQPPRDNVPAFESFVPQSFDKPVILKQSPQWARWITISIMGVTTAAVAAAFIFKVDESIMAQGKLEPKGVVQLVQAPVGGVVKEILVEEGESVEKGQVVATLNETSTEAQIKANEKITQELQSESAYYSAVLSGNGNAIAPAAVSNDLAQRGRDRNQLQASNQMYRAQISGNTAGLSPEQLSQVQASSSRLSSQQNISKIQANQFRNQRTQTELQLANAKSDLATNQEILESLRELNEKGAVARLSFLQQEQEVNNKQSQVNTLQEELGRLTLEIAGAEESVGLNTSESAETLYQRIEANEQRIADIDSQLSQRVLDINQKIAELASQRAQLAENIDNQALTAPVAGQVFNLKANRPGYVANTTEPMMEIVPQDALVARVFIPSKDIGFVKVGQKVDVRIDAYSYSEYGDMEGTVKRIASDALPPDETFPYARFPAEIELENQKFISNEVPLDLRPGMSLNTNIKLRKRRVITFLTDLFVRKVSSVQSGS
jgi:hemolysin D